MKSQKFRVIYSVFIALFTVAIGLAIICVTADIYYSGKGTDLIYSREIVGERLEKLAIPVLLYLAALVVGIIFPLQEVKAKTTSEETIKKLKSRMPATGEGEEYLAAEKAYKKYVIIRNSVWLFAIAFALACGIASLCYLLNTAHFSGTEINNEIFKLAKNIIPLTLSSLAVFAAAAVVNGIIAKKQLKEIRTMIKLGEGKKGTSPITVALGKAEAVANNRITVWAVRGVVFVIAVTFIIVGALNGGANDVLIKAINICTECIGLG